MVLGNEIPLGFQDKFVNAEQLNKPLGAYHFPRIGSFEVYYKGNIVFSKLATLKWPHPAAVAEKVKQLDSEIRAQTAKQAVSEQKTSAKTKKLRQKSKARTKGRRRRGIVRPNPRLYSPPKKASATKEKKQSETVKIESKAPQMYPEDYYGFERNRIYKGSDSDSKEDLHTQSDRYLNEYQSYEIDHTDTDYNQTPESKNPFSYQQEQNQYKYRDSRQDDELQMLDIEEPVVHSHLLEREGTPLQSETYAREFADSQAKTHQKDSEKYDQLTKEDSYLNLNGSNTNPLQKVQLIKIPTNSEFSKQDDYEGTYEFGTGPKETSSEGTNHKLKEQESSYDPYYREEFEQTDEKHSQRSRSSSSSSQSKHSFKHAKDEDSYDFKDNGDSKEQDADYEQEFQDSSSDEEESHPLREVTKSYNVSLPSGTWTKKVSNI
jgi:hypothetical protein